MNDAPSALVAQILTNVRQLAQQIPLYAVDRGATSSVGPTQQAQAFASSFRVPYGQMNMRGLLLRLRAAGIVNTDVQTGLAIQTYLDGTLIADTTFVQLSPGLVGAAWLCEVEACVQVEGQAAQLLTTHSRYAFDKVAGAYPPLSPQPSLDITADPVITWKAYWQLPGPNSNLTLHTATMELHYPRPEIVS